MKIDKHVKYFIRCLNALPGAYTSIDTSRMTILFFALSGLDLLNALDKIENDKNKIIDWIYSLQILPDENTADKDTKKCGFRGSSFLGGEFNPDGCFTTSEIYEGSHIAMTYTALLSLLILGDDLSRVNKKAITENLKSLQLKNGSFYSTPEGSENDMRFLYCACCISYIIDNWSGVNKKLAVKYVQKSMGYDHGISQGPQLESHGGSTFCAVAALHLMGELENCFDCKKLEKLKRWCLVRQKSGFQGRPNKPVDTCYSFWVGASLKLLDCFQFVDIEKNREFLLTTQHNITGGFSKWPNYHSDALHTYFGICGMSLMNLYNLQPLSPALNISERAHQHLKTLHNANTMDVS